MLKYLKLKDQEIPYTLRKSWRARRLRLSIYIDGRLVVTQPRFFSDRVVESFLVNHAAWIIKRLDNFKTRPVPLLAGPGRRADYLAKKETARRLVNDRLEHFNKFYNLKYKKISIRNQATRWGSCSRRGNLSFNYRLVDLTPAVADYIIVHELCHLREFNHSSRFWRLVAQTLPNYKELRRGLRNKTGGL